MVFAELSWVFVALFFQQVADGGRPVGYALVAPGHADGQVAPSERDFAPRKGGAAGGGERLRVHAR